MRFLLKLTLNRPTSDEIMAVLPAEQRGGQSWPIGSLDGLEL